MLRALGRGFLGRFALQDADRGSGLQPVLSVNDDLLVRLQSGVDERLAVADLRNFHVTQDRASLPIDDVSKRSLCTLLHHRCRYGQPIMPRVDEQPHIDQFARPKPVIRVGKFGLEAD